LGWSVFIDCSRNLRFLLDNLTAGSDLQVGHQL
jgi:hypothetical protein